MTTFQIVGLILISICVITLSIVQYKSAHIDFDCKN